MLYLMALPLMLSAAVAPEKLYVVERERASLAVIENNGIKGEIKGLGDLSHGIVKFHDGYAYVVSRDGYISKVDVKRDTVEKTVKAGESSIGVDFSAGKVCIANYEPHSVLMLDYDLNVLKTIDTDSRNVGIKGVGDACVFSLMDKDEIWVADGVTERKFPSVGAMPFDAFIEGRRYIVGFFKESSIGVLDMESGEYKKIALGNGEGGVVFKIPHFGTWGALVGSALIPAVGERKLYVVELDKFRVLASVELIGLPVFVVISPDNRYAVVNYSGDKEDFISIYDIKSGKIIKDLQAAKRVMHMRFSGDGGKLYLSSYFENMVKVVDTGKWEVIGGIEVPTPSGIFIVREGN